MAQTNPSRLAAAPGDGTVTLTWSAGSGGPASYFAITDGAGQVLDRVGAAADGSAPAGWVDGSLVNGTPVSYKVSAGNAAGESAFAGPVTATPTGASTPPGPNHAPTAMADSYETDNKTALTVPAPGVLANDTDPDTADTLTAALKTKPLHGTVALSADGPVTYTPKSDFVGTDSFSYVASDAAHATSGPAKVTITVTAPPKVHQQRIVLVQNGHPPLVLCGTVDHGFTTKLSGPFVVSVTGSSKISGGHSQNAVVSINIVASGRLAWKGSITIDTGHGVKTFSGNAVLWRAGGVVFGTLGAGNDGITFTIAG